MVLLHIDYIAALKAFIDKVFRVHAKDLRVDRDRLDKVGIMAPSSEWTTPVMPGYGDVDWGRLVGVLVDGGYSGPINIEMEHKKLEGNPDQNMDSIAMSGRYLRSFVPKTAA